MKSFILFLWRLTDPIYYTFTRLHYTQNSVFRVRLTRYKGKPIMLSDGCRIARNDLLIKIHFHNVRIFKELFHVKNDLKKARLLYREVEHSLPSLASYIQSHRKQEEIKGVIGITMINRGYNRLGFEGSEISSRFYKWAKRLIQVPIYVLTTSSPSIKQLKKLNLNYLFMSKDSLLARYAKETDDNQKAPSVSV